MQLSFNLDDIEYLKLDYNDGGQEKSIKLALKEKRENEFVAVASSVVVPPITSMQRVSVDFITHDGLYKTKTALKEVIAEGEYTYFVIENPYTLDYQQNREYYRVLAKYDAIYTVDNGIDNEAYNAVTYDISAGGVSIVMDENVISSQGGMSIVICLPEKDIKSHLKFIRCEMFEEDQFKLSFEFTDLSERDYEFLSDFCVKKQMSSF